MTAFIRIYSSGTMQFQRVLPWQFFAGPLDFPRRGKSSLGVVSLALARSILRANHARSRTPTSCVKQPSHPLIYSWVLTSLIGSLVIVCLSTKILFADTVYLKNGRSIEGIIQRQTAQNLDLEVGFGVVTFQAKEIVRVEKSDHQKTQKILEKWQEQKKQVEEIQRSVKSEPVLPAAKDLNTIVCPLEGPYVILPALLNWSIDVPLMLDTGASLVVLSKEVGDKLAVNTLQPQTLIQLQIGDGSKINAAYVLLKCINIQGVEVKDVDAAVLLDDKGKFEHASGVLGMSFLKNFNIKIDRKEKKFILEKIGDR